MPHDYENLHDIESMDDDEIQALIEQELTDNPGIDPADVEVRVANGRVTLEGRVGTEQEYQAAEHIVTDLLGMQDVSNQLVIDELRRGEQPEAADEAAGMRSSQGDTVSGDRTSDTAEHLLPNTSGEQFGTGDMSESGQQGYTYNP